MIAGVWDRPSLTFQECLIPQILEVDSVECLDHMSFGKVIGHELRCGTTAVAYFLCHLPIALRIGIHRFDNHLSGLRPYLPRYFFHRSEEHTSELQSRFDFV